MRRSVYAAAVSGAVLILPATADAQVETIPAMTVTVGGAYSTSPFLQAQGGNSGAFSTQIDVRPSLTLLNGTQQAVITANYNRADYLSSRYGSNNGYGVAIAANKRFDPRTSLGVNASFNSSILGANNGFATPGNAFLPTAPGAIPGTGTTPATGVGTIPGTDSGTTPVGGGLGTLPVTTPILDPSGIDGDVGLIGVRQRRNLISGGVTGSYVLSPLSSMNAAIGVSRSSYPGRPDTNSIFLSNFNSYNGSVGYSRSLSELASVGFQLSGSYSKFGNGIDTQIYTPRITYNRRLSERWTMSAGVGAGITRQLGETHTILSLDGSLCRATDERTSGCLTVARVPSVSGIGGARVQNTAGLSFSHRFDENWTGGLSGSYSHVSQAENGISPVLGLGSQDLFFSDASVQRRLGRRLSAVGGVGYRRGNTVNQGTANDFTARLGLTLAVGRFQ